MLHGCLRCFPVGKLCNLTRLHLYDVHEGVGRVLVFVSDVMNGGKIFHWAYSKSASTCECAYLGTKPPRDSASQVCVSRPGEEADVAVKVGHRCG